MKPTTAELDRRIEEVKQALITAMPRYAIVRNMAERYGVAERTADNYIAKAKTALKVEHEADRPYLMAEHVAHRRNLRAQFRRQNDYYGELKAAQDEAKLLGLYPATRHELGGPDGGPVQHEHKGEVQLHGGVEHVAAVLSVLAEAGAIQPAGAGEGDDAQAD